MLLGAASAKKALTFSQKKTAQNSLFPPEKAHLCEDKAGLLSDDSGLVIVKKKWEQCFPGNRVDKIMRTLCTRRLTKNALSLLASFRDPTSNSKKQTNDDGLL